MGLDASAAEVVPRNTLYDAVPALADQLRLTWPVPGVAERLADGAGTAGAALTVSVRLAEPVPLAFVAAIVTVLVPAVVGVAVMASVATLTLHPTGSPVAP